MSEQALRPSAPAVSVGLVTPVWQRAMMAINQNLVLATLVFVSWDRSWNVNVPGFDLAALPFPYMRPVIHLSELLALAAVAAYVLAGCPGLNRLWRGARLAYSLSLLWLLCLTALSSVWAIHRGLAAVDTAHMAIWVLFALMMATGDWPGARLAAFFLAGVLVQSAFGISQMIVQHFTGWHSVALGELPVRPEYTWASVAFAGSERLLRAYGLSTHPNVLGGTAAVALLLVPGLILTWPRVWRALVVPAWAIAWILLLLTFSRSAWGAVLAGALAGVALLARGRHLGRKVWTAMLTLAAISIIASIAFAIAFRPFIAGRVQNVDQPIQSRSSSERAEMLSVAVRMVAAHPLLGVGAANFCVASRAWTDGYALDWVHNVPLLVASQLGLPGLALFALMLAALAATLQRRWRDRSISTWQALAGAGLVALVVVMQLDHYVWTGPYGTLMWALLSGWWMSGGDAKSSTEDVTANNGGVFIGNRNADDCPGRSGLYSGSASSGGLQHELPIPDRSRGTCQACPS